MIKYIRPFIDQKMYSNYDSLKDAISSAKLYGVDTKNRKRKSNDNNSKRNVSE